MRTPEQKAIAEMVRGVLGDIVDLDAVKAEKGLDIDLVPIARAGLIDLLAEGDGTVGDLAIVVEELGRHVAPHPVAELALGATVAGRLGLQVTGPVMPIGVVRTDFRATSEGGEVHLAGSTHEVVRGDGIADLLVIARDRDEMVAAVVPADTDGVSTSGRKTLDLTRRHLDVRLDEAVATSSSSSEEVAEVVAELADTLDALVLCDALGATEHILELTVEHVTSREQFGQPIGAFQAVKHQAADMRVALASSRAVIERAVDAIESGSSRRAERVSSAVVHAAPALSAAASTALQLHGGMGFTWEHDLHLYVRRVTSDELRGDLVGRHRSRLRTLLG